MLVLNIVCSEGRDYHSIEIIFVEGLPCPLRNFCEMGECYHSDSVIILSYSIAILIKILTIFYIPLYCCIFISITPVTSKASTTSPRTCCMKNIALAAPPVPVPLPFRYCGYHVLHLSQEHGARFFVITSSVFGLNGLTLWNRTNTYTSSHNILIVVHCL